MTADRNVWPELNQIFQDVFMDDGIRLNAGMTSMDVVGWDSLTNISLMSAVQDHFKIRLSIRDLESMKNVGDLAACVIMRLAQ